MPKSDGINWPKYVPIPTKVGCGVMYTMGPGPADRRPACALGYAHLTLCNNPYSANFPPGMVKFRDAYVAVARVVVGCVAYQGVAHVNDSKLRDDKERALVYNAAWAYLGYTEGQSEEVLDLVKKAKKLAKKAKKS